MKTKGQNARHLYSRSWLQLIGLMLLAFVISACSSSGLYRINLMPAPAVFEDGKINPLPKGQPPVSYDGLIKLLISSCSEIFTKSGEADRIKAN